VSGDRVRLGQAPAASLVARTLPVPGRIDLPEIRHVLEAAIVERSAYVIPRERTVAAFDADALPSALTIRPRRRGDRIVTSGGEERRLKTLLIAARVPRWERARVPVVEAGEVLWVAGLRRSATAPITERTRRVLVLSLVRSQAARSAQ
jgi:tRNA(Ile)-lysidine synthase